MPTASYQSANDYNLVKDIRPFDMPYEAYMREIGTKQQYFKVGADRVKSIYDQAAGLDPQYTQGKEYLKGFMQDASKNLEKISKSDLGILDNAQQASRIFKPLFDTSNPFNYALLQDSQLNQHYKKQDELSNLYRTKDGGKDWNINNEIFYKDAQKKYQEDAQTGDYSTIGKNFQNRKSFIPYYNGSKELTEIQEACKGFSSEIQTVNTHDGGYLQNTSKKGCDPQRLALAFQTQLSDRFKQQAYIDGYVHFKGNEDALLTKFNDISLNQTKTKIDNINTAIAGLRAGKVTKEEQDKIDDYNSMLSILEPQYKQAQKDYNEMTKGNPLEYVKNNYDKLAGQIYFNELTNSLGEAFRTDEIKEKLLPNAVVMQQRNFNFQIAERIIDNAQEVKMAGIDHRYKMDEIAEQGKNAIKLAVLKGEISGKSAEIPSVLTPNEFGTKEAPHRTESDFIQTELAPIKEQNAIDFKTLKDYIEKKENKKFTVDEMKSYMNEHNGKKKENQDPTLARIYSTFTESANALRSKVNTVEAINEQVKISHPELYTNDNFNTKKNSFTTFRIRNNEGDEVDLKGTANFSEQDIADMLVTGKVINGFSVIPSSENNNYVSITYNGKKLSQYNEEDGGKKGSNKIFDFANSVYGKLKNNIIKINEEKAKIYTDDWINNGNYTKNTVSIKKDGFEDKRLRSMLGVVGGEGEKEGYRIVAQTSTGEGLYVQKLDKDGLPITKNTKTNESLASIKAFGAENDIEELPMGSAYKVYGISDRYTGLGTDKELAKYKNIINDIKNIAMIFNASPLSKSSNFVNSSELPEGRGIITTQTNTGRPVNISIRKEGNNTIYIAEIKTGVGMQTLEAATPVELITLINQN